MQLDPWKDDRQKVGQRLGLLSLESWVFWQGPALGGELASCKVDWLVGCGATLAAPREASRLWL